MRKVLIVGNGVSRLQHKNFIDNWQDELWVCNSAYKEFGHRKNLSRIIADASTMPVVVNWAKVSGTGARLVTTERVHELLEPTIAEYVDVLTTPSNLQNDSGTSLVAQALQERYDEVYVAGFDLGGKDIYVPNHEKKSKTIWVECWRRIAKKYSLERIKFVGHDHKPFILSSKPTDTYAKVYTRNQDHIKTMENFVERKKKSRKLSKGVLILGNGVSRTKLKEFLNKWDGEIWACNWAFKEAFELPRLDRIGSVHKNVLERAEKYKKDHNLSYSLYGRDVSGLEEIAVPFDEQRGWSTGSLMLVQALKEGYKKILLAGFDMGGPDIYQQDPIPGGNFKKQFETIHAEFDMSGVFFANNYGLFPVVRTPEIYKEIENYEVKENPSLEKKVVVVGNGPSVLSKKLGKLIDSFERVVRVNDFRIENYAPYIGKKTTDWVTGVGVQSKVKGRDVKKFKTAIALFPLNRFQVDRYKNIKNMDQLMTAVRNNLNVRPEELKIIKPEIIEKLYTWSQLKRPSTGLMAILYYRFVLEINPVFIYGFDSFSSRNHYYDSEGDIHISNAHDWNSEKKVLETLIDRKMVYPIEDLIQ